MSGFIALHREAREHHLFKGDVARFGAWFWLVSTACWRPVKFNVGGSTITLQRSQLCVSIRQLAEEWGWSKSAVERFLTRLQTETMITTEAGRGRTIITICNYEKYQDSAGGDRDTSETATETPAGQQRDTKEQGNKGTIEEEPIGSPSMPETQKRAESRAVKLPADWTPMLTPAAQRIVDGWPPGKFDHEVARFRDHAADKGRTSKDWQAAFRTWITKSDEWMKQNGNRNSQAAGGFAAGNRGPVDNRNSFLRSLDESIGRSGSGQPDGPD